MVLSFSHHAAVEIPLHLAEGVGGHLSFARDNDADIGDGEGGVWLTLWRPAIGDVDSLRRVAADVGRAAGGCALDEVASLLQPLLPLIQYAGGVEERQSAN